MYSIFDKKKLNRNQLQQIFSELRNSYVNICVKIHEGGLSNS